MLKVLINLLLNVTFECHKKCEGNNCAEWVFKQKTKNFRFRICLLESVRWKTGFSIQNLCKIFSNSFFGYIFFLKEDIRCNKKYSTGVIFWIWLWGFKVFSIHLCYGKFVCVGLGWVVGNKPNVRMWYLGLWG